MLYVGYVLILCTSIDCQYNSKRQQLLFLGRESRADVKHTGEYEIKHNIKLALVM